VASVEDRGMLEQNIVVSDRVDQIEKLVGDGLDAFNEEITGRNDRRALAVIVQDPLTGAALGGATGRSSLGLLFLDLFYLPEELRGSGIGSQVLRLFEDEGRRRGCRSAVPVHDQFPGTGFLRAQRVAGLRRDTVRSAGHEPGLHDQGTVGRRHTFG
jgi:GNAT superfamily N-acetyltransferase